MMSNKKIKALKCKQLSRFNDEEQKRYIEDFVNSKELFDATFDEDTLLGALYDSTEKLLYIKVYLGYEDQAFIVNKGSIRDILIANQEYLDELKLELETLKNSEYISYAKAILISRIENTINMFSNNVYRNYIPCSENRKSLLNARWSIMDNIFKQLSKIVNPGTKRISKIDTNFKVFKCIYDIISNREKKQLLIRYLNNSINVNDLPEDILFLVNKLDYDELAKIIEFSTNRSFLLESYLILFLVNYNLLMFNNDLIIEYIDDERLEAIQNNATTNVEKAFDEMCLRFRMEK